MLIGGKEYKTGQRIKVINAKSILHLQVRNDKGLQQRYDRNNGSYHGGINL